ncbi:MAG TPA: FAD-binding protein, partial [Myxococcaceae bacterium]
PEKERDYFLESKYPGYGNLVPRDIASRELFLKCFHEGRGIFNPKTGKNENEVFLDVTHLPEEMLRKKLAGILEIYEKFVGDDPYKNPMKVFPAVHYSMGGLWVDFERAENGSLVKGSPRNQATNIEGLYAAGECDYQYHGANRLGANSLLSCIYGGMIGGPAMVSYAKNTAKSAQAVPSSVFEDARARWVEKFAEIDRMNGSENPYVLSRELGEVMTENVTVVRRNDRLRKTLEKLAELKDRWSRINVLDHGHSSNRPLSFVNQLWNMFALGEVITRSALLRDESRGAHYKPEFQLPEPKTRDPTQDPDWMKAWKERHQKWAKTTIARWTPQGSDITYEDIPTPVLDPEPRWYA